MQLWEQLLAQKAQPVDTERNSDFDSAFGLQEDASDDGPTAFTKGLQSSLLRNSPQGHELTMEMAKMKMANQLQLNLEKQKMELARQYPTYEHVVGPFGAITAFNKYDPNDNKTIYPQGVTADMVAGKYTADAAKNKAEEAKANTEADPKYQAAVAQEPLLKNQNMQSEMDYRNGVKTDMDNARIDKLKNGGSGAQSGFSESEIKSRALDDVRAMPESHGKLYGTPQDEVMLRMDPDLNRLYQERLQHWRTQARKFTPDSNGLVAPAGGAGQSISDQINGAMTIDPNLVGLPTYGQQQ